MASTAFDTFPLLPDADEEPAPEPLSMFAAPPAAVDALSLLVSPLAVDGSLLLAVLPLALAVETAAPSLAAPSFGADDPGLLSPLDPVLLELPPPVIALPDASDELPPDPESPDPPPPDAAPAPAPPAVDAPPPPPLAAAPAPAPDAVPPPPVIAAAPVPPLLAMTAAPAATPATAPIAAPPENAPAPAAATGAMNLINAGRAKAASNNTSKPVKLLTKPSINASPPVAASVSWFRISRNPKA